DPHCHTDASDGMVTPAELVAAAVKAGLDLIAVTDHDTMASVKEAQARGEAVGLTVVAGQEVTTRWPAQTHVMGWFLKEPVERGKSLEGTVDIGRALTSYEGDFRTAVTERTTKPTLGVRRRIPPGIVLRQQWRALVDLPLRRRRERG